MKLNRKYLQSRSTALSSHGYQLHRKGANPVVSPHPPPKKTVPFTSHSAYSALLCYPSHQTVSAAQLTKGFSGNTRLTGISGSLGNTNYIQLELISCRGLYYLFSLVVPSWGFQLSLYAFFSS